MNWHKDILLNTIRKEVITACVVFAVLLVLSIIQIIYGKAFEWKNIEVFSTPDLWDRVFWSAFTFATLGSVLYRIYFYKILSIIFGSDRENYRQAKSLIWMGLMYVNYKVFPYIVDMVNYVATILYNVLAYAVDVSPLLLTGAILGVMLGLFVERKEIAGIFNECRMG